MPLGGQVIMRMNRGNREDQNHVDEQGLQIILATGHKSYGGRLQQAALRPCEEGGWEPGETDEVVLGFQTEISISKIEQIG